MSHPVILLVDDEPAIQRATAALLRSRGYAVVSDQLNISSTIPLSQALPARPSAPDPTTYKLDPKATPQLRSWPERYTIPYVDQWNRSLHKSLTQDLVWELGYVRNHGFCGEWIAGLAVPIDMTDEPMPAPPTVGPAWLPTAFPQPSHRDLPQFTHHLNLLSWFLEPGDHAHVGTVGRDGA